MGTREDAAPGGDGAALYREGARALRAEFGAEFRVLVRPGCSETGRESGMLGWGSSYCGALGHPGPELHRWEGFVQNAAESSPETQQGELHRLSRGGIEPSESN